MPARLLLALVRWPAPLPSAGLCRMLCRFPMAAFLDIFNILGPILLMVSFGALLRWKFRVDLGTHSKLNIYLFLPCFVFEKIAKSALNGEQMVGIVVISTLQVLTLGILIGGLGKVLRVQRKTLAAIA